MSALPLTQMWKRNSLSIVMLLLFILSLIGQAIAGFWHQNQELLQHQLPTESFTSYLASGDFWEATFENWESEFLQMAIFVLLSAVLYQRGSAQSQELPGEKSSKNKKKKTTPYALRPGPVKAGGLSKKLYSHSLSLALFFLFAICFVGHLIGGAAQYNQEQLQHGKETLSVLSFLGTSQFWYQSFQNWQSEFLSVAAIVLLSIFLRQKDSPESKEVDEPHSKTGTD